MSGETIIGLVIGAIAGLLGNLLVGYLFYQRSGAELRTEAERLRQETGRTRQMVNTLAHALEVSGQIDVVWDEHGELKTFVIRGYAKATRPGPTVQATGTVTPPARPRRKRIR